MVTFEVSLWGYGFVLFYNFLRIFIVVCMYVCMYVWNNIDGDVLLLEGHVFWVYMAFFCSE